MDRFAAMNTFVRVAELGTLSAAARELGLTQPAVSQQIAALERHLDVRLFHRSTRQLALTEGGETYYQHARHILQAVDEAEESAGELSSALRGNLRVAWTRRVWPDASVTDRHRISAPASGIEHRARP